MDGLRAIGLPLRAAGQPGSSSHNHGAFWIQHRLCLGPSWAVEPFSSGWILHPSLGRARLAVSRDELAMLDLQRRVPRGHGGLQNSVVCPVDHVGRGVRVRWRSQEENAVKILNTLPADHPLRNKPMGEIHTEIRTEKMVVWMSVKCLGIEKATFNQLPNVWTNNSQFRAHDSE